MSSGTLLRRAAAPLLLVLAVLTGCENPVGPGEGGGHPTGVAIFSGNTEVATYTRQGNVKTGTLRVDAGAQATFAVQFITASGGRIALDGLEYSVQDPQILLSSLAVATQLTTDTIRLTGNSRGTTTLRIDVWHGNHREFIAELDVVIE